MLDQLKLREKLKNNNLVKRGWKWVGEGKRKRQGTNEMEMEMKMEIENLIAKDKERNMTIRT